MSCNRPLPAWRGKERNDSGKLPVTFRFAEADTSLPVTVPCGRCMGCRLEKARGWAIRMVHEAKLHKHNAFVTLTYSDGNLRTTRDGLATLDRQDFTLFMKRLRKLKGNGIRYYQCGEYGEETQRPHHHAILFNCHFPDLVPLRLTRARDAHTLYKSNELEKLWHLGIVTVGQVNFETAAYVASYVTKKLTGPTAEAHYRGRVHEYATMSRRPGIAKAFLEKFRTDIYPSDTVIVRGHEMRPPKYYDRILEKEDPEAYEAIKYERDQETLGKHQNHYSHDASEANAIARMRKRDAQ